MGGLLSFRVNLQLQKSTHKPTWIVFFWVKGYLGLGSIRAGLGVQVRLKNTPLVEIELDKRYSINWLVSSNRPKNFYVQSYEIRAFKNSEPTRKSSWIRHWYLMHADCVELVKKWTLIMLICYYLFWTQIIDIKYRIRCIHIWYIIFIFQVSVIPLIMHFQSPLNVKYSYWVCI